MFYHKEKQKIQEMMIWNDEQQKNIYTSLQNSIHLSIRLQKLNTLTQKNKTVVLLRSDSSNNRKRAFWHRRATIYTNVVHVVVHARIQTQKVSEGKKGNKSKLKKKKKKFVLVGSRPLRMSAEKMSCSNHRHIGQVTPCTARRLLTGHASVHYEGGEDTDSRGQGILIPMECMMVRVFAWWEQRDAGRLWKKLEWIHWCSGSLAEKG